MKTLWILNLKNLLPELFLAGRNVTGPIRVFYRGGGGSCRRGLGKCYAVTPPVVLKL